MTHNTVIHKNLELELDMHYREGQPFNPLLLQSALGKDTVSVCDWVNLLGSFKYIASLTMCEWVHEDGKLEKQHISASNHLYGCSRQIPHFLLTTEQLSNSTGNNCCITDSHSNHKPNNSWISGHRWCLKHGAQAPPQVITTSKGILIKFFIQPLKYDTTRYSESLLFV